MINSMSEIEERYEKIKDHKPRASKKLNEIGDILASAYKIDADRADEMWQYIVDLNVSDDITFSKFYVAQVFNKLTDRLKPEEATELITMNPERVRLMIFYGYDGGTLWHVLNVLLKGYIQLEDIDNAEACVELFYEKFGGINSGVQDVFNVAKNAAGICTEMIKAGEHQEDAEDFLVRLGSSENDDINDFVELVKALNNIGGPFDYEALFDVALEHKFPVEFFDLLWAARDEYDQDELRDKWIEYVDDCEETDVRPYNYIHEDEEDYLKSKLRFYVDLEKEAEELLDYYFNRPNLYDVEKGIIWSWIENEDWERFTKYIALVVMSTTEDAFEYSSIHRELDQYVDACFMSDYMDHTDGYGRSYKELMKKHGKAFADALAKVSAITTGCDCHDSYHEFVKAFIQKQTGDLNTLHEYGFDDQVETRSAEEQLKDYVHQFLMSGKTVHEERGTKYSLIQDALRDELNESRHANHITVKIDVTAALRKALGLEPEESDDNEEEPEVEINETLERDYRMASDDELAEFYFQHCPREYMRRKELLSACIQKNDVNRAIELIDLMAETKGNDGYEELNGWGRQNMLTLHYLIDEYAYGEEDRWNHNENITDEMRQVARQLVYRMLPHLSEKSREEIKGKLYKIDPEKDDSDEYINQLLEDADVYTTFPKPRGKGGAPNINRMSDEFIHCFERLSKMGRLDVVATIMGKFAAVRDVLKPVTFDSWMSFMARGLKNNDLIVVFRNNPEIFEAWLENDNLRDWDIIRMAEAFGESCTRAEFMSFRNMVVSKKGMVDGLDAAFKVTSENTETQTLFDGIHAKVELDYLEITGSNPISTIEFHLLTEKKTDELDSVRIVKCKINGIETDDLGSYSDFDDDNGPDKGYSVYRKNSSDEITVYSDFFEDNDINQVNKIELQLVLMNDDAEAIENITTIVIELDSLTGEYKVTNEGESQGSLVSAHEYDGNNSSGDSDLSSLLRALLGGNLSSDSDDEYDDEEDDDEYEDDDEEDDDEEDDDEEDDDETFSASSEDFEDITFWDDHDVRIDFCGLEFDDEEVSIKFCDTNHRDETIKLFAMNIRVNGVLEEDFSSFHTLESGDYDYALFNVSDITNTSYEDIHQIDLAVEIDDDGCSALYKTKNIHIECNTYDETFKVVISNSDNIARTEFEEDEEEDFEDSEKTVYEADDVFDDVTIYSDDDVIVDFCGLEFNGDSISLSIWCDSSRDEDTEFYVKSLRVNGQTIMRFHCFETLSAYGSEYSDIEIEENEDFDYDDIHSIELIIEVDNENSEALGDTQVVRIECDTDEETYSVDFD